VWGALRAPATPPGALNIAPGRGGEVLAVMEGAGVQAVTQSVDERFGPVTTLVPTTAQLLLQRAPQVSVDSAGGAAAVWLHTANPVPPTYAIDAALRSPDGTWTSRSR
jgi:hypothetical protein